MKWKDYIGKRLYWYEPSNRYAFPRSGILTGIFNRQTTTWTISQRGTTLAFARRNLMSSTNCKNDYCHRQAYYTTTCEACLVMELQALRNLAQTVADESAEGWKAMDNLRVALDE